MRDSLSFKSTDSDVSDVPKIRGAHNRYAKMSTKQQTLSFFFFGVPSPTKKRHLEPEIRVLLEPWLPDGLEAHDEPLKSTSGGRNSLACCSVSVFSIRLLLFSPPIGRDSGAEAPQGQSEESGAGPEGSQEAAGAVGGGATLLASESEAEESEPEPETAPAKPTPTKPAEVCSLNRNNDDDEDDKKKRSGLGALVLGLVGLGKKNQNSSQINPE
ncbi:hypothetical protein FQN60_007144, partial [Etheostoma spectabile]